jgi:ribosome maturation factor RimP
LVTVTTAESGSFTGRIISCDETAAVLRVDGRERPVLFADVVKARIQVEFSRKEG